MNAAEWIDYHRTRAEQERILAGQAGSAVAAKAHNALAALHEERVLALREDAARERTTLHAVFAN